MPTREAAELAYMISRPYLFGEYPKYFGDFKGMQAATPVQVMEMGSTIAPTINVRFSSETDLEKYGTTSSKKTYKQQKTEHTLLNFFMQAIWKAQWLILLENTQ